jgi:hypothetical protein
MKQPSRNYHGGTKLKRQEKNTRGVLQFSYYSYSDQATGDRGGEYTETEEKRNAYRILVG